MSLNKRPIDKKLISISKTNSTTQQSTDLITATFPCTITGLRWSFAMSGSSVIHWAIVILRDGETLDALGQGDASTLYNPEQNVMAFGVVNALSTDHVHPEGSTKTMRKLQGGDKIVFVMDCSSATGSVNGCVQLFCKT